MRRYIRRAGGAAIFSSIFAAFVLSQLLLLRPVHSTETSQTTAAASALSNEAAFAGVHYSAPGDDKPSTETETETTTSGDSMSGVAAVAARSRAVRTLVEAREQAEGAGARVRRAIGNAALRNLDPFLMLDEFSVRPPAGFPEHPHRGFQTVTYMLDGAFKHEDNRGNSGVIRTGGVQWMTAGRGVIHSEMPLENKDNVGLQLWVNLAAKDKMMPANYQDIEPSAMPIAEDGDVRVRVIAGSALGKESKIFTQTPAVYYDVTLGKRGATLAQPVDPSFNGFVYVLDGAVRIGGDNGDGDGRSTLVRRGFLGVLERGAGPKPDAGASADATVVRATAESDSARFVLVAGKPLNEPIVQHGPFVMNSREEIMQAFEDYHRGAFAQ